ncbi:MAG TPA: hypothetical protein VFB78_08745 [Acidimicrobiales bacterium]|nr:hypothetical protein [Acidimicrobiales bacterium]
MLFLHELIDIVGEGARKYMELTARFDTESAADRGLTLFGTWQVVGVTGRWPQVVNLWTIDGWDGWGRLVTAANVKRTENKPLAEWWQEAYATRTGGFDRLLRAHGEVDDAAVGELWVHEVTEVRPGAAADYLAAVREEWAPVAAAHGHHLVGAFDVQFTDVEVVTLWATDVASHLAFEQADLDVDWPARRREFTTRWREELLVPGLPERAGLA